MNHVTHEFLKDEEITINHIRKRLEQVADGIKTENKKNLTDINIICEEIFGEILNQIFDLNCK